MGEYVWTVAKVGGKLTRAIAVELQEIGVDDVGQQSYSNESDTMVFDFVDAKEAVIFDGEVNYGNPERLMDFCREHGLAYQVTYAAQGGCFGSGGYVWFPGMEKPREFDADDGGNPSVALSTLQDRLRTGKTLAEVVDEYEITTRVIPPLELVEEKETV